MGGGKPNLPLTADQVAAAVVAAARSYGDDPVKALTSASPRSRRGLFAAADALAWATGQPIRRTCGLLGLCPTNVSRARRPPVGRRSAEAFEAARSAALAALGVTDAPTLSSHPAPSAAPASEPPPAAAVTAEPAPPLRIPPEPARLGLGPRTLTATAVRAAIREILHIDNATAPDLAEVLRLSEAQVRQGLRELAELGELRADPLTVEGWRQQFWRWAPKP